MSGRVRRVVTGHDAAGRAIVLQDGEPPVVIRSPLQPGLAFHEIWNTSEMPQTVAADFAEPTLNHSGTAPPKGGTVIRIVDLPPEGPEGPEFDKDQTRELLAAVGLAEKAGRHPLMHRTESIDYAVVLSGNVVLLLDDSEVHLTAGDVVVQRGTVHAWTNRTDEVCRLAFVLTDGRFEDRLAETLAERDGREDGRELPDEHPRRHSTDSEFQARRSPRPGDRRRAWFGPRLRRGSGGSGRRRNACRAHRA